jgi:hypothetical protein
MVISYDQSDYDVGRYPLLDLWDVNSYSMPTESNACPFPNPAHLPSIGELPGRSANVMFPGLRCIVQQSGKSEYVEEV